MGQISKNFSKSEIECKCGCGAIAISPDQVMLLQGIRDFVKRPVNIASAVRCRSHNTNIGSKDTSSHIDDGDRMCEATDIMARTSREKFEIIQGASRNGCIRIGVGKDFVHVDTDKRKSQRVVWTY